MAWSIPWRHARVAACRLLCSWIRQPENPSAFHSSMAKSSPPLVSRQRRLSHCQVRSSSRLSSRSRSFLSETRREGDTFYQPALQLPTICSSLHSLRELSVLTTDPTERTFPPADDDVKWAASSGEHFS